MQKIQPLCILAESADKYLVRFLVMNGAMEDYTFSFSWTGEVGVLNSDQPEFYLATFDDPATTLLLKAIGYFDETRRGAPLPGCLSIKPVALLASEQSSREQGKEYRVQFQSATGEESEYIFKVDEAGALKSIVNESAFLAASGGHPPASALEQAISNFHKARLSGQPSAIV